MYDFEQLAVEDASLATGPWSEVVNILWDGTILLPTVVLSSTHSQQPQQHSSVLMVLH